MLNSLARRLFDRFAAFRNDRRGQISVMFYFIGGATIIAVGAAVDYTRAATQRSNLQQATDSTVLAMAHGYLTPTSTSVTLADPTQSYLTSAMNAVASTALTKTYTANGQSGGLNMPKVKKITLSNANTQICIDTSMIIPTTLMTVVGTQYLAVGASACAQAGGTFEVALALDNSGSMSESAGGQAKIDALQSAANSLIDILIPDGTVKPNAAISIVPFTALVNVGSSQSAAFLDVLGKSSIHWQNFHIPSTVNFKPTSKLTLFANMNSVSWGGCVEDRPPPYTTTDTAATTAAPDTMFVPFLSPDDPGAIDNKTCSGLKCETDDNNYTFYNSYLADDQVSSAGGTCTSTSNKDYIAYDKSSKAPDGTTNIYPGGTMTMACKYQNVTPKQYNSGTGLTSGPNFLCSSQAITPLTTNKTVLENAINAMAAGGSTNVATGFMWGWRTISPVVNPFPVLTPATIGPQAPKTYNYGPPENTKVVILMTDGFNSWTSNSSSPWLSTYESFGYYKNNRISSYSDADATVPGSKACSGTNTTSSTYRCQMDNVTLEACKNAKAAGVVVYTVAFTVASDPIDAAGINLLKTCATDSSKYFLATDSTTIVTAFQQIAQAISSLRVSQ